MKPKGAVLFTSGTNCDFETSLAFTMAGGISDLVHTSLLRNSKKIDAYQIIIIPGGFSYGDHFGSATVWAGELQKILGEWIAKFLDSGKLVIGICNGFQVLVKLGIIPNTKENFAVESTLTNNVSGKFESRWVKLKANPKSPSIFTKNVGLIDMPVAHGEGNFLPEDIRVFNKMITNNQIVFQYVDDVGLPTAEYPKNPNGSFAAIAGICDTTGRAFGLMPHPERFIFPHQNIKSAKDNGLIGLSIYKNVVNFFK